MVRRSVRRVIVVSGSSADAYRGEQFAVGSANCAVEIQGF